MTRLPRTARPHRAASDATDTFAGRNPGECAAVILSISCARGLTGAFWTEGLDTVLTRTIPSQFDRLGTSGIVTSPELKELPPPLRTPRWRNGHTHQVLRFNDIGKWTGAAPCALSHRREAVNEGRIKGRIDAMKRARLPDGCLNFW